MERKRSDDRSGPTLYGAAIQRADVTAALRRAFFREWAKRGYSALSLEAVAARAGVGKAALYRRWPSKPAMARSLIEGLSVSIVPAPDTGSLRGDVAAFQSSLARVLRHPLVRRILPDLQAECARSGDLGDLLNAVTEARRARGLSILDRAVARGDFPEDVDRTLALDLIAAPIYWRLVATGGSLRAGDMEANVVAFLRAVEASDMP